MKKIQETTSKVIENQTFDIRIYFVRVCLHIQTSYTTYVAIASTIENRDYLYTPEIAVQCDFHVTLCV